MSQALASRYDRINDRARELISELMKIEVAGSKKRAQMIRVLTEMHSLFKSKPVELKFGKFEHFEGWLTDLIKPLTGLEKRSAYYYIHIGKHLLGKVTDEELEEMGIERAKELSKVAETKGKVTKEFVEKAMAMTVQDLKEEVRAIVFKGNPSHEQEKGGQWATIEIRGPQTWIGVIQAFLTYQRRQEGHKRSDAEIVGMFLDAEVKELKAAEDDRRKKIAGTG